MQESSFYRTRVRANFAACEESYIESFSSIASERLNDIHSDLVKAIEEINDIKELCLFFSELQAYTFLNSPPRKYPKYIVSKQKDSDKEGIIEDTEHNEKTSHTMHWIGKLCSLRFDLITEYRSGTISEDNAAKFVAALNKVKSALNVQCDGSFKLLFGDDDFKIHSSPEKIDYQIFDNYCQPDVVDFPSYNPNHASKINSIIKKIPRVNNSQELLKLFEEARGLYFLKNSMTMDHPKYYTVEEDGVVKIKKSLKDKTNYTMSLLGEYCQEQLKVFSQEKGKRETGRLIAVREQLIQHLRQLIAHWQLKDEKAHRHKMKKLAVVQTSQLLGHFWGMPEKEKNKKKVDKPQEKKVNHRDPATALLSPAPIGETMQARGAT